MKNKSNKISNKITFTILLASLISVWMTNFLYSFVMPQTLLMESIERSSFYKRTFLLTITIGSIAVLLVYLFYRRIEKAIKTIEKGGQILKDEYIKVEKAFKNIETFLFLIGALSYILAVIINITIEILSKRGLDYKYWSFRTILAISFGILNGIVVARVINYAWIDAKNALNIHFLKEKEFKIKTNKKLIIPILMLSFVNISFFCVAIFIFFDRYAFTFIKFSFIFKHFILLFLKFIIVDFIILFAIILEHQKHIDHLYKQFDIMANLEMDLSKRVNIVSFDEIGMMISNINVVLKKLQDSFITISRAEKEVSDLSVDTQNAFKSLKEESDKLSMLIKEVQKIEDNESKIVEKANNDFTSLIIAIENTVSKYKFQSDSVEKTSISMKNILNSFQVTSRLMIETDHLFESLASNIYKGEDQLNLLTSVNRKMIESNSKIQEITKLILDISERSSLLAMNAAIEAAHAGESGVGFSVVAEEMRKLSENTSDSAQQIELIVKEMMDSNKEAEESNISIEKLFSQIHEELNQTSSKMKMVTKNAEEQTSLIDANITEVENLITINEEIKETTEKIIQIQPTVIHSLKELQNITKSLLENNNIMIDSVSKMNGSTNIASLSFTKMIDSIGNLKQIILNYKIEGSNTDSLKIDHSNKELRLTEL